MRRLSLPLLAALAVAAASGAAGCSSGGGGGAAAARASTPSGPASAPAVAARKSSSSHIVVLVMENKERDRVIGSPESAYVNSLSRRYATPTRFYGVSHPSLPNYLALTAGTTFGVTSDCTDCLQGGRTLVDQLQAAHVSWKAYMEGMPSACFTGAGSGRYAKKHDPFVYYRRVIGRAARCRKVVPATQLARDLRAGRLPTFSFVSPDLCNDTHDCPVATGDRYLSNLVPGILRALGPRGFLVLTWDEGSSSSSCCGGLGHGGLIPTIIAGPRVKRGAQPAVPYTHYSTLRTIEDALRLPRLRAAGDPRTAALNAAFKRRPRIR